MVPCHVAGHIKPDMARWMNTHSSLLGQDNSQFFSALDFCLSLE